MRQSERLSSFLRVYAREREHAVGAGQHASACKGGVMERGGEHVCECASVGASRPAGTGALAGAGLARYCVRLKQDIVLVQD